MQLSRRWILVPVWFKVIIYFYLLVGILIVLALVLRVFGILNSISIYGISANDQFSLIGFLVTLIFILKSFVGLFFITGHDLAPNIAIIDTIIGIVLCVGTGFVFPLLNNSGTVEFILRIELIFMVPLLIFLKKLKKKWSGPVNAIERGD
jgi:hypothetical protein